MKVFILGCGMQGTGISALLAMEEDINQLILADNNQTRIKNAIGYLDNLGGMLLCKDIKTKVVDALQQEELVKVIKDSDLVFNATGNANLPIMHACLDAGAHYLDLSGFPFEMEGIPRSKTMEPQFELNERFKAAGLTAIPSAGGAPGWTDLAARYIIDQLDTVDAVIVRFGDWFDSTELISCLNPIAIFIEYFGAPGYPLCYEDGEIKKVDLWESEEDYQFPEPVGLVKVFSVNVHGEIYTIPRFTGKSVRRVEVKGGFQIGDLNLKDLWLRAIGKQMAKHRSAEIINMFERFADSFIKPWEFKDAYDKGIIKDGAVCFTVEVTGTKGGKNVHHTVHNVITLEESMKHLPWAIHGIYATTGAVPLELILMIGRNEIETRGVLPVASLDNYKIILQRVRDRGHLMTEHIEQQL